MDMGYNDSATLDMRIYIKERVDKFGMKVCNTLNSNVVRKGKGKWDNVSREDLLRKLKEEFLELIEAIEENDPEHITLEATDVSAVCMMIHDNFGEKL